MINNKKLSTFSLGLYVYTLFIILWGAWVRISKSGDGCGDSWPLCDGSLIPEAKTIATWIEFGHRLTTGLFGLLVIYLYFWIRKKYPKENLFIRVSTYMLLLTVFEALVGAMLVKLGLVAGNDSFYRVMIMSLHQVSSLLLSGSIAWIYLYVKKGNAKALFDRYFYITSFLFFFIVMLGPLASLSATLFPTESLLQGLMGELSIDAHWVIEWRSIHPFFASTIGGFLIYFTWLNYVKEKDLSYLYVLRIFAVAIFFGAFTLLFLYPVWMKLTHLLIAHLIWFFILNTSLKKI